MIVARRRQDENAEAGSAGVGVRLRWRRGHRLSLAGVDCDTAFRVESGCLICDAELAEQRRQVLLVLFPGDVVLRSFLPPLPGLAVVATTTATVMRLRRSGSIQKEPGQRPGQVDVEAAASRLLARSCLFATARGRLSAEECLATLLADIAIRMGRATPSGWEFDLPLSRRDMADFLALNPDSLSRMMSRFRQRRLIAMPSRSRAIAGSIDALLAATPLGEMLRQMAADA